MDYNWGDKYDVPFYFSGGETVTFQVWARSDGSGSHTTQYGDADGKRNGMASESTDAFVECVCKYAFSGPH